MMRHYDGIKAQNPDCIIFYRLGDFYEMFYDDAVKASKILDLTLTGRDCGLDERAPMCGVPYHAANEYIAKLVAAGEKVAVCEQLEDPSEAKGLVERGIVKIITAGTLTEDELLDEKTNNFIACVFYSEKDAGYAWCDITTGDFFAKKCESKRLVEEISDNLLRINPSEIICNEKLSVLAQDLPVVAHKILPPFKKTQEEYFSVRNAENTLKEQFGVISFQAFGIADSSETVRAAGALVAYLKDTQKRALVNVNGIKIETAQEYMYLDSSAIRNLELTKNARDSRRYGSLLHVLDKTDTAMGARTLNSWILSPLQSKEKIEYRLNGVEELFKNPMLKGGISEQMKFVRDTERLSGKISNGNLTPRDCFVLGESLSAFPNIKLHLFGVNSQILKDVDETIADFTDVAKILRDAISETATKIAKDGGYIRDGFDPELDRLRRVKNDSAAIIKDIESREREATGIKNLKIGYNRVFGYYIEVTNSFKSLVPYNYVRKQTLTGAERYITEELKNVETDILSSDEKALKLEASIFAKIKTLLLDNVKKIQRSSKAIACLDALCSLATAAKKNGYVRPEITEDGRLDVVGGRHPVVETVSSEPFVSNDAYLDSDENRIMIVTGPNMAGKSTYMRQIALIAIMAHIGSFVPCKSASIPVIDKIFTRVGANDNLIFNQSTFMVEMTEVASILLNATSKSLLILDEVGRGTSTYDGLSIAWAVIEYLSEKIKAKTLFATHYHELSELEGRLNGVKNYKITVRELGGKIVFLRKIARGSANRSFGIEVASLAGVPKDVTDRAKLILKNLEKNDLTKNKAEVEIVEEKDETTLSEVEEILAEIDVNSMTPMDALKLVYDLKNKLNER